MFVWARQSNVLFLQYSNLKKTSLSLNLCSTTKGINTVKIINCLYLRYGKYFISSFRHNMPCGLRN